MRSIGFTGTSDKYTRHQHEALHDLVKNNSVQYVLHHGDCVGADALMHQFGIEDPNCIGIHIHPPERDKKRAWCGARFKTLKIYPTKPYLERNHDIVDASNEMVALPGTEYEVTRSGTWATIRYTRKNNIPITIIYPSGRVEKFYENGIFNTL